MSLVRADDLHKAYGGVQALNGVGLQVESGTIHAIVGENGAGKSTLMKILAGVVRPDAGSISVGGQIVDLHSGKAARQHGIGIVYQELSIFPDRPVLANLFVNREPRIKGLISRREMERAAIPVLERLGLDIDLDVPVGQASIGERQLIELARVLLEEPRVLILDEPNSALNDRETQRLFTVLRELRSRDITIIYVSHRLEEVFQIADRISVMRDGQDVLTDDVPALDMPQVVEAMVGAAHEGVFPTRTTTQAEEGPALVVRRMSVDHELSDVTFAAHGGEVVGLTGLEGSGVGVVLGALFGILRPSSGAATYPDGSGLPTNPTEAARRGISFVPADRKTQGLMLDRSVASNLVQVDAGALTSRTGWLSRSRVESVAGRQIHQLKIKVASIDAPVSHLSGGNQQKVVIGKWLEVAPDVLLLDDPTRGVDVGAKQEIYTLVRRLAEAGHIILLRSTELPELIGLADRILVFYRGRLATECAASEVDESQLLHAINTGSLSVGKIADQDRD